jgi:hypothetical protein
MFKEIQLVTALKTAIIKVSKSTAPTTVVQAASQPVSPTTGPDTYGHWSANEPTACEDFATNTCDTDPYSGAYS